MLWAVYRPTSMLAKPPDFPLLGGTKNGMLTLDLARVDYDTPFFTGNATCRDCPEKDEHPDNIVCIEEITCSPQSAINYVAQGMYSARAGQSLEMIFAIADEWNFILYGHDATEEEKYWIKFGFNFYLDLNP